MTTRNEQHAKLRAAMQLATDTVKNEPTAVVMWKTEATWQLLVKLLMEADE
jgi:hypothetical protein